MIFGIKYVMQAMYIEVNVDGPLAEELKATETGKEGALNLEELEKLDVIQKKIDDFVSNLLRGEQRKIERVGVISYKVIE